MSLRKLISSITGGQEQHLQTSEQLTPEQQVEQVRSEQREKFELVVPEEVRQQYSELNRVLQEAIDAGAAPSDVAKILDACTTQLHQLSAPVSEQSVVPQPVVEQKKEELQPPDTSLPLMEYYDQLVLFLEPRAYDGTYNYLEYIQRELRENLVSGEKRRIISDLAFFYEKLYDLQGYFESNRNVFDAFQALCWKVGNAIGSEEEIRLWVPETFEPQEENKTIMVVKRSRIGAKLDKVLRPAMFVGNECKVMAKVILE